MPTTRRRCAVKTNINNLSPATSARGVSVLERFGNAPIAPVQGTGLSFAGVYGADKAPQSAPAQHGMALGTVRTDDARVPEPRGRQH